MAARSFAATTSSPSSATDDPVSGSSSDALNKTVAVWLALLAFSFPVSIAASSLTFFPLIGLYLLAGYWTFQIWPPVIGRVEKAFAVFFAVSLASAGWGFSLLHSRRQLLEDLYVLLIPLLVALLRNAPVRRVRLMKVFLWGGLFTAAFGLLQTAIGMDQNELTGRVALHVPALIADWPQGLLFKLSLNDGRATGLRSHPLTFAEGLLFGLAYLLSGLAVSPKMRWGRWLWMFGVLLSALLVSQSRGPWIAFGVMALTAGILDPRPVVWRRLALLMLVPVILLVTVPTLRQRVLSIGDTRFASNSERLQMWRIGARVLQDHPLLGVGPGNIRNVSASYQTPEQHQTYGHWGHLHNTYVHIAAERGILGLAAFLFFIGTLGWTLLRALRRLSTEEIERRTILLTALLGLTGWLVSGLTEAVYNNSSIQMMFYFTAGLALASVRKDELL
jgi:putative inorganic carbon (hco3(-)) transporter